MTTIKTTDNQWETGVILTSSDGNRLEAIVVHLPGSEPTFHLASVTLEQQETGEFTDLFSFLVK